MEGSLVAYKVFTNGSVLQASEINDNLMKQAVSVFSNAAARTAAITSPVEGQMTYLEDTNELSIYNGSSFVVIGTSATNSYNYVDTIYYTSSGTFTKATYPWLRAIKVKVQGAGGGTGGCNITGASSCSAAGGGGGGCYTESFITDISGLAASVTVTRGAGGAGSADGFTNGSDGGTSSFGSLVTASGGFGGQGSTAQFIPNIAANGGSGGSTGTGDFKVMGTAGETPIIWNTIWHKGSAGGTSFFGGRPTINQRASGGQVTGQVGQPYGGGANGPSNATNQATQAGAAGGNGIVIVELYA